MSKKVSPMDNHPQIKEKPGILPNLHYAEQVNDRFLDHLP